jgi:hypothetical protein
MYMLYEKHTVGMFYGEKYFPYHLLHRTEAWLTAALVVFAEHSFTPSFWGSLLYGALLCLPLRLSLDIPFTTRED